MLRSPYPRQRLIVLIGVVGALTGIKVLWEAATLDDDLPVAGLVGYVALVLVGVILGSVGWIVRASRRDMQRPAHHIQTAEAAAVSLLLGIMLVGVGVSAGIAVSTGSWSAWPILVGGCVVGGLQLGLSFMMNAGHSARTSSSAVL